MVRLPQALGAVLSLLIAAQLLTSPACADPPPIDPELIAAEHRVPVAQLGYVLFDAATNDIIESHQPHVGFIPASVTKVPTAVLALATLGPRHRFKTRILIDGSINDGVLEGDLVLQGGGDPFLDTADLADLAEDLRRAGLTGITGRFLYDASLLAAEPAINPRQPQAAAYNPGVSALSVNFNRVRLDWRQRGGGLEAALKVVSDAVERPAPDIEVAVAGRDFGAGIPFVHQVTDRGHRWSLSSGVDGRGSAWLPVKDPAAHAAHLFRDVAADNGLALPFPVPGRPGPDARHAAEKASVPLDRIAEQVLRYSNNMSAELIGLAATRALSGEPRSLVGSAGVMSGWFQARYPMLDWSSYIVDNHSGLSSAARATPFQTAVILAHGRRLEMGGERFRDLLRPIRWGEALAEAQAELGDEAEPMAIVGKSGTVYFGRGFAGFMDTAGGRELGFVIYVSDVARRAELDAAMDPRALTRPRGARTWRGRARALEQAILTAWATGY